MIRLLWSFLVEALNRSTRLAYILLYLNVLLYTICINRSKCIACVQTSIALNDIVLGIISSNSRIVASKNMRHIYIYTLKPE